MPTKKLATKKTPVRKVATKKTASKRATKATKKQLVIADNNTSFWVRNGEILNSLLALKEALSAMDKSVYSYHVSVEHNDFANWVEVVLCDGACALDLRKAKTPVSARTVVVKHLKSYNL